jgi:membrane protease YdiL (CAAX protease family)
MTRGPGAFRAFWILVRMAVRQKRNRFSKTFEHNRIYKTFRRTATAPRQARGGCLLWIFGVLILFESGLFAALFLSRLETRSAEFSPAYHDWKRVEEARKQEVARQGEILRPEQEAAIQARWIPVERCIRKTWPSRSDEKIEWDRKFLLPHLWKQISNAPIPDWLQREHQSWNEHLIPDELKQYRSKKIEPEPEPDAETTARIQAGALALRSTAVSVLLVLLCLTLVFVLLGSYNRDLGQVGWSLAWLFTFPVPSRALFLARLGEYALGNFMGWFVFLPFFLVYFFREGCGVASILLAPAAALFLNLMVAAVQLVSETWLRQHLDRSRLKNVQAICTVLGMGLVMGVFSLAIAPFGPDLLLSIPAALQSALAWTPPGLPALLTRGGSVVWLAGAGMLVAAFLVAAGAVAGMHGLTRAGLIRETNPYRGTRRQGAGLDVGAARSYWFQGVVLKDLRLLWRDRNLFVQTLVVPVVILGFQVVINPGLLNAVGSNFQHALAAAFGLGVYTLVFSAMNALLVEGGSVWLLFTLPVPLERILLRKAILWGTFASLLPALLLVVSLLRLESCGVAEVSSAVFAIAGIYGYAVIATHLGALGTRMFETDVRRRMRASTVFLFMLLAGLYVSGFYVSSNTIVSLWTRIVMLGLCGMLALAVRQKVRDHAPYLLDPASRPAWRLSLADGLIAVFLFTVLQGLLCLCFHAGKLSLWTSVVVSYVIAGAVVSGVFWIWITARSQGRPLEPPGGRRCGFPRTVMVGLVLGLAAGVGGLGYLAGIELFEPLSRLREAMPDLLLVPAGSRMARAIMLVVAAPLVEEYLFRGLVYRGLRRSARPAVATLASAAIFALVHPMLSMPPVFVMGVFAALAFERTGRLAAPILVHAVYNAVVLWQQFW